MNQNKKGASLTSTTRLSPLAKPFTINRSNHQPSSNLSVLSAQEPSIYSLDHCNNDPFSSLLDSFRKISPGSKGDPVVSVPLSEYGFGKETATVTATATATTTLPFETATQTLEKSLCQRHPFVEFQKHGDFDGLTGSDFDMLEEFSLPTHSLNIAGLGYGTSTGNELSYGKQGVDFHELSLFGLGHDVGSSATDGNMLQKASDGIFKKSTGTIMSKDILSNSKGTLHTAVEPSSSLKSNCEVAPVMLSTSDMSSAAMMENIPQNQSSTNLGDSDSDVDSPCWKGTMAFCVSPPEISGSVKSQHVEKVLEKSNSLNPMAPQFIPGRYVKDDSVASKSSAPVAINLLSGQDILMKPVTAESHPAELNQGVELQHCGNIFGREKEFNMLNDPKSSFVDRVLNSRYLMTQSPTIEDRLMSKGKLVTTVDVDGCVKETKDPRSGGSISRSFPAKGHFPAPTTSSPRVGVVTNLFKTLQGVAKSLIKSSKPDVQIMVKAMHVLSELLVENCADGLDSYNEHDHDLIQQIINNLNVFSTKECGQGVPTPDSTHTDSPCCLDRSSEPAKGLEVTSIETLTVPHQLYPRNDFVGQNGVSKVVAQRGRNSFASSSDEDNEIFQLQVIRRSLGKSLDVEKQLHPEALLFRNLWLDSEAERCFTRYKTYCWLMEAGMDINCRNVAELWR